LVASYYNSTIYAHDPLAGPLSSRRRVDPNIERKAVTHKE
jgi:hypothetical protein